MKKFFSKIKDKIEFNAPVTIGFCLLCFLCYVLNLLTGGFVNDKICSFYKTSFGDIMTYLRSFTHIIGHADHNHLFSNMMYLLITCPMLEEKYGSLKLLAVMATTAVFTALLTYFLFPGVQILGASGVVFAAIILSSFTGGETKKLPLSFVVVAIVFLGQQITDAIWGTGNIAYFAHFGGALVGILYGFAFRGSKKTAL